MLGFLYEWRTGHFFPPISVLLGFSIPPLACLGSRQEDCGVQKKKTCSSGCCGIHMNNQKLLTFPARCLFYRCFILPIKPSIRLSTLGYTYSKVFFATFHTRFMFFNATDQAISHPPTHRGRRNRKGTRKAQKYDVNLEKT